MKEANVDSHLLPICVSLIETYATAIESFIHHGTINDG